jgi:hypothetical protein
MLTQVLVRGSDDPPRLVDFDGEPQVGDFVYLHEPDGRVLMYEVGGRFWRLTDKPVSSLPGLDVNRRVHQVFIGVRLVATERGPIAFEPGGRA